MLKNTSADSVQARVQLEGANAGKPSFSSFGRESRNSASSNRDQIVNKDENLDLEIMKTNSYDSTKDPEVKRNTTLVNFPKPKVRLDPVSSLISQQSYPVDRQTLDRASVEHTLAMIKPEGMPHKRQILARFRREGFMVLAQRTVQLTPEQVSDFYRDLYGNKHFPLLVASTSSAPVAVYCLGRPDAVDTLREVVGPCDVVYARSKYPDCLNAQYGNADCNFPAVHASCDPVSARREVQFFFPRGTTEREKTVAQGLEYLDREVTPLLREGLALMLKQKPAEPMLWLADWLLRHNPRQPLVPDHLRHQHFYPTK